MTGASVAGAPDAPAQSLARHRALAGAARLWLLIGALGSVALSIYVIFGLGNTFGTYVPLENEYFYLMLGLLLPLVFLLYPAFGMPTAQVPWHDWSTALATLGLCVYLAVSTDRILNEGWEYSAPGHAQLVSYALWVVILEALRRAGGTAIFAICLLASVYPMLADLAPGPLHGQAVPPDVTAGFHVFGTESVLGIPMNAFANLVVGFLVFGVALQYTGGGAFFLNLAFALLGRRRGGPAKVAIFASGLMGSMSGSVITNVLTTGVMSIPAMKRVGFGASYAAGVEACASTGGVLMPPVMGATAFVMATFIEQSYASIVVAAAFPSVLYYLGLFLQIDAYAARHGLRGLPAEELPTIGAVFREGWYFIAVFALLIFMLLYLQREAQAPYYATALLLAINQCARRHRWNRERLLEFVIGVGRLFTELAAILAGVGLIIGSLTLTGKVGSLTYELVRLAGDNVITLLVMGAVTSFVLGIGMTVTAAYLFLAVTLAPALVSGGLDKMAVHLFMLYWGMISFITPPVALGAYAAASLAGADPIRTGFQSMRLGSIIYFVPFFFVLNPALIGQGSIGEIVAVLAAAVAGIALISGGLQGYVYGLGALDGRRGLAMAGRVLLVGAGIILALPGGELVGHTHLELALAALATAMVALALAWLGRRQPLQPA
ncbi:MAG: TRAP transporter fused permease subunit [Ectothiorhodospiraceae bacterium]|nr:TRAP transporter fused permease subunit [Chromatiales bacterium]MCP5155472.1 TRAP transporter fused permease subunit [Ectothiorhodospiraceae bacterium]